MIGEADDPFMKLAWLWPEVFMAPSNAVLAGVWLSMSKRVKAMQNALRAVPAHTRARQKVVSLTLKFFTALSLYRAARDVLPPAEH